MCNSESSQTQKNAKVSIVFFTIISQPFAIAAVVINTFNPTGKQHFKCSVHWNFHKAALQKSSER
jgi:hypothetical protein